jgi:cis-3-alkyl-4-acyloxetan-2-one decarboxylase
MVFERAPELPAWLQAEMLFQRRVYRGGRYAIHFVDEGAGPLVILQHGNPTWSYLWRKVVGRLAGSGVHVIAPDLVGLGLSDKPRDASMHTLTFHAEQIEGLVRALELERVIIVGQDWGGPVLGLVAARNPGLVHGAVFANTGLAAPRRAGTLSWFHRLANMPVISDVLFRALNFPIPTMHVVQGDRSSIGRTEKRAYRYPLRSMRDRTAPLALARMVPTSLSHPSVEPMRQVEAWASSFGGPVRLVWGQTDPILGRGLKSMRRLFPSAAVVETQAGHFLQEEVPDALADAILAVVSEIEPGRPAETNAWR